MFLEHITEKYDYPDLPTSFPVPDCYDFICYDLTPKEAEFSLLCCNIEHVSLALREEPWVLGILSEEETERWRNYHFAKDKDMFFLSRALVKSTISTRLNIPVQKIRFTTAKNGKPTLEINGSPSIDFNISHSNGLVFCAVSGLGKIGVDTEGLNRTNISSERLSNFVLSKRETVYLNSLKAFQREKYILSRWTLKEAYTKALGLGLTYPFKELEFEQNDTGDILLISSLQHDEQASRWTFGQFLLSEKHICSWAFFK